MQDITLQDATAVILIGPLDFGRCRIAARLHRALWPLFDRPMLEYQLKLLARQGLKQAVVCVSESADFVEDSVNPYAFEGMSVDFVADGMPRGAAGSVRDAVYGRARGPVIVIKGGVAWVGDAPQLIAQHLREKAALTVFTTGFYRKDASNVSPAGIYVCEPSALEAVSPSGYQDIKEQLIPTLLKEGRPVRATPLPGDMIAGLGHSSYLAIVERALRAPGDFGIGPERFVRFEGDILIEPGAEIAESARIFGPAAVLRGAVVGQDSIIAGPAVVGRGARVGREALIDGSVLWEGARVGDGAMVTAAVIADGANVAARAKVEAVTVAPRRAKTKPGGTRPRSVTSTARSIASSGAEGGLMTGETRRQVAWRPDGYDGRKEEKVSRGAAAFYLVVGVAVAAAFFLSSTGVLADLWRVWKGNDNYSSGVLVPFLAGYVIWTRRKDLAKTAIAPFYWGIVVILAGFAMRLAGSFLIYASAERLSVVVVAWGVVLTIFGVAMTKRLRWVLIFLLLMLPWPNRIYTPVSLLLQDWATGTTVFLLEILGYSVVREGNVLTVGSTPVTVAEACSGLRMLTAFMVISGLVALVCRRSLWEKALVFASSVPIAVACNTLRLTVTAMAFTAGYGPRVNDLFHGIGGYAMMPLALAIMGGELWVTRKLFVPAGAAPPEGPAKRTVQDGAAARKERP